MNTQTTESPFYGIEPGDFADTNKDAMKLAEAIAESHGVSVKYALRHKNRRASRRARRAIAFWLNHFFGSAITSALLSCTRQNVSILVATHSRYTAELEKQVEEHDKCATIVMQYSSIAKPVNRRHKRSTPKQQGAMISNATQP